MRNGVEILNDQDIETGRNSARPLLANNGSDNEKFSSIENSNGNNGIHLALSSDAKIGQSIINRNSETFQTPVRKSEYAVNKNLTEISEEKRKNSKLYSEEDDRYRDLDHDKDNINGNLVN